MSIRSRALRKIKQPIADDATININDLRRIVEAATPLIEDMLDIADQLAAFRETADTKSLDWSQLKNLIKAKVLDERDAVADPPRKGERVKNLTAKAGKLSEYFELLRSDSGDKKSPDSAASLAGGRTGHSPMRAGCDDNAPAKEVAINPSVGTPLPGNAPHATGFRPTERPTPRTNPTPAELIASEDGTMARGTISDTAVASPPEPPGGAPALGIAPQHKPDAGAIIPDAAPLPLRAASGEAAVNRLAAASPISTADSLETIPSYPTQHAVAS